jgi:hypothetical protein
VSHLTQIELEELAYQVGRKCDRPTNEKLARLLTENRELRDQHAERQFMYDLEPDEG